jgi:hypothetical protein
MRFSLFLILVFVSNSFISCGDHLDDSNNSENVVDRFNPKELPCLAELIGLYIGDFGENSIRLELTYINKHKVLGYNLLKGLQRNLSGDVFYSDSLFTLTLNEPGDHEYDGKFILTVNKSNCTVSGEWQSNSGKIAGKQFKLEKIELIEDFDAPISLGSFANRFYFLTNQIGHDIQFFANGKVVYTHYIQENENSEPKPESFNGNWYLADNKVVVEFSKNNVFKDKKVFFKMTQEEGDPGELLYDTLLYTPSYFQ